MSKGSSSSGIGLFGMMFIVFLTLKLLDKIDWSWWWVSAPLWIPLSVGLTVLGGFLLFAGASTRRR